MTISTDTAVAEALAKGGTIDMTTIGRKTGLPRRIEIWFTNLNGRIFITGMPGKRGWYANLLADPRLTIHLKKRVRADLPAVARPITDSQEKEETLAAIFARWRWDSAKIEHQLPTWLDRSPLIEVEISR